MNTTQGRISNWGTDMSADELLGEAEEVASRNPDFHMTKEEEEELLREEGTQVQDMVNALSDSYTDIQMLGAGTYGTVFRARSLRTGKTVAVKVLGLEHYGLVVDEMRVLSVLSMEPRCYEHMMCLKSFRKDNRYIYIEQGLIEGMDMRGLYNMMVGMTLQEFEAYWTYDRMWSMMRQLAEGLNYIHEKGYAHLDIKPENIMVDDNGVYKYIDFGFTCSMDCKMDKGSPNYMPPEMFTGERQDANLKGSDKLILAQAQDVWSLGIVFHEMTHGGLPLGLGKAAGNSYLEYLKSVKEILETNDLVFSESDTNANVMAINRIIYMMLAYDWRMRINANSLLAVINSEMKRLGY